MVSLKLYGYWRSSSAYRVRIALHTKGLAFENLPINLLKGEQRSSDYLQITPTGFVPALVVGGRVLTESLAICEWLEEMHPSPPLLPSDAFERAWVRSLALLVASRVQPRQNLSVLQEVPQEERAARARRVIEPGLLALEQLVRRERKGGPFCAGATVSLAEVCLVPQLYAARRFGVELGALECLLRAEEAALQLPAFVAAHPDRQPDAQPA